MDASTLLNEMFKAPNWIQREVRFAWELLMILFFTMLYDDGTEDAWYQAINSSLIHHRTTDHSLKILGLCFCWGHLWASAHVWGNVGSNPGLGLGACFNHESCGLFHGCAMGHHTMAGRAWRDLLSVPFVGTPTCPQKTQANKILKLTEEHQIIVSHFKGIYNINTYIYPYCSIYLVTLAPLRSCSWLFDGVNKKWWTLAWLGPE